MTILYDNTTCVQNSKRVPLSFFLLKFGCHKIIGNCPIFRGRGGAIILKAEKAISNSDFGTSNAIKLIDITFSLYILLQAVTRFIGQHERTASGAQLPFALILSRAGHVDSGPRPAVTTYN